MKNNKYGILAILLLAAVIFTFTGCDRLLTSENVEPLAKFNSYEELLAYMENSGLNSSNYLKGAGAPMPEAENQDAVSDSAQRGGSGTSFGETNVQTAGVDEADIIKNDGRYIYYLNGNNLVIVDAADASDMNVTGKITLDTSSTFSEMYKSGNLITAIGYTYEETTGGGESSSQDSILPREYIPTATYVFANVYDVSDKANPVLTREYKIEGNMLSSRMISGKLYLVTNKWAYYYGVDAKPTEEELLPRVYDSKTDKETSLIPADTISFMPNPADNSIMTISVMDTDNNKAVKTETVMGGGSNIYMSTNSLYIVKPQMRFFPLLERTDVDDESASTSEEVEYEEPKTQIHKYDITAASVRYAGYGEVKGDILNQFSMDEFNGFFRIATTHWTREKVENNVFILDNNMNTVGGITGLAPGETIYSVRFTGNTGYVVTFRNIDPLFVLDLSDPTKPVVTGELKIPGFSNYLHPVGDNLLVGIGMETREIFSTDEKGNVIVTGFERGGIKVSLFDVSNPYNPVEKDVVLIGDQGSYTDAQHNHKAVTWWPEKNTIAFSATMPNSNDLKNRTSWRESAILITVGEDDLALKGMIPSNETGEQHWYYYMPSRVTYIDNTVYYVISGNISSYDFNNLAQLGSAKIMDVNYPDYRIMPLPEPVEPEVEEDRAPDKNND